MFAHNRIHIGKIKQIRALGQPQRCYPINPLPVAALRSLILHLPHYNVLIRLPGDDSNHIILIR